LVCEFTQEFDVEEEDCRGDEFGGDDVEEDLGTVVFICFCGALGGFEGFEAEGEQDGAVGEEECFLAFRCMSVSFIYKG